LGESWVGALLPGSSRAGERGYVNFGGELFGREGKMRKRRANSARLYGLAEPGRVRNLLAVCKGEKRSPGETRWLKQRMFGYKGVEGAGRMRKQKERTWLGFTARDSAPTFNEEGKKKRRTPTSGKEKKGKTRRKKKERLEGISSHKKTGGRKKNRHQPFFFLVSGRHGIKRRGPTKRVGFDPSVWGNAGGKTSAITANLKKEKCTKGRGGD